MQSEWLKVLLLVAVLKCASVRVPKLLHANWTLRTSPEHQQPQIFFTLDRYF